MFKDMDEASSQVNFEFQNNIKDTVFSFLSRFDAIFTLNQDLLLERHYLNSNVGHSGKWDGWNIPGMKLIRPSAPGLSNPNLGKWEPDEDNFNLSPRLQP
jgi:hypothetical protein